MRGLPTAPIERDPVTKSVNFRWKIHELVEILIVQCHV